MTAFPSAPSSNRTAGFPQYGFPTTFPAGLSATVVVDTRRATHQRSVASSFAAFPPPVLPLRRRLVCFAGQFAAQVLDSSHVHSIASYGWRIHASFPALKRGRSMALRSRQVMLSCPSSLQDPSDFPSTRNACLAGFIQLRFRTAAYRFGRHP